MKMSLSYQKKENGIHYLNPFVKLSVIFIYIVLGSIYSHPIYLMVLVFNILLISYFADCFQQMVAFFRFFIWMGVFVFLFNFLLNRNGETILFTIHTGIEIIGDIPFTLETAVYAIISILKLMVIIFAFSLGNFIINPDDLLRAMMKLKLPYIFSLLITMSLRFFPLILQDLEQVSDVQKARGLQLEKGNAFTKIKNRVGLILPLLSNSLDRAVQVAEALESKGFGRSTPRIYFREIKVSTKDILSAILFGLLLTLLLIYFFDGFGFYEVYPLVSIPKVLELDLFLLLAITITTLVYFFIINQVYPNKKGEAKR